MKNKINRAHFIWYLPPRRDQGFSLGIAEKSMNANKYILWYIFWNCYFFWLDFCFIDYGEFVSFVHYNKTRKPEKVFFLSHPSVTVSYSVISILLLFLLPSKELPVRIKMNKQESSSKLFSQFSPAPVRSVILLMFSKRCHYFARLLPSPCAGLQLVTRTVTERKNITWTRTFPKFCLQGDRL